ncbi:MAG: hypothetical protein HRT89_01300, partial [Lentisphaeria bacterium]|nr:hypothetical protein [Lentisphaeria bacterium]NQZ66681.1 hypothetical protein [Lentisphaeria bacterium]
MNSKLNKSVGKFCAWHRFLRAWRVCQVVLLTGLCLYAVFFLVDKLIYVNFDHYKSSLLLGTVALIAVLLTYLFMPSREMDVCYLIDKNAGHKNLIFSSLEIQEEENEISRLLVDRANTVIDERKAADIMPFKFSNFGKFSFLPALAILAIYFMPEQDLLKREEVEKNIAQEEIKKENSVKLIHEQIVKIQKRDKDIQSIGGKNIMNDLMKLEEDLNKASSRKDAISRLNDIEKKYEKEFQKKNDFEKATRNLTAQMNASGLHKDTSKALKNLQKNMQKGNMAKAAKEMRKLAGQMEGQELTQEEKDALARELQRMMRDLQGDEAADELADALKKMKSSSIDQNKVASADNKQNKQNQQKKNQQKKQNQQNKNKQEQSSTTPKKKQMSGIEMSKGMGQKQAQQGQKQEGKQGQKQQ